MGVGDDDSFGAIQNVIINNHTLIDAPCMEQQDRPLIINTQEVLEPSLAYASNTYPQDVGRHATSRLEIVTDYLPQLERQSFR
jgi:hypothetical protein